MSQTYITFILCIISTLSYAMEKDFQINCIQDIPKISLDRIETYVNELPNTKSYQIKNQLSDSFTFNIALLPKELRYTIVMNMFNQQKELAELYYKAPLISACTHLHEARKAVVNSSLPKKKQEKLVKLLFRLPTDQTKKINTILNPSFNTRIAYDGLVISEDTLAALDEKIKKVLKDQDIGIVNKFAEQNPLCAYTLNCLGMTSFSTLCSAGIIFPAAYLIPFLTCGCCNYCPPLSYFSFLSLNAVTIASAALWTPITPILMRKRDQRKKIALLT
jgi:hypothetical protein